MQLIVRQWVKLEFTFGNGSLKHYITTQKEKNERK